MRDGNRTILGQLAFLVGGLALLLGMPNAVNAQQSRDFLFGEPHFSLAFNLGYGVPRAGSEIYDFVMNDLTVDKTDFNSIVLGGSFGVRVTSRVEVGLDVSYANSNTRSEFREWVDQDDLPIEQNTRLSWVPVTATVKAYLWERGRRISQLAWVPGKWSPFVGVGGGKVYYTFKQNGDFVDFETYEIFFDTFRSEGNAGIFHVLAGAEWSLSPRFYLTGEGRYSWAEADMDRDFVGFDPIDLSGFQGTVGLALRF
jgi:hypothetical protein